MAWNEFIIPTLLLAVGGYWIGHWWGRRLPDRRQRKWTVMVAALIAAPGLLYALYYLHLFDDWLWFYRLRALPGSEMLASGVGILAGLLNSWRDVKYPLEKCSIPFLALMLVLLPHFKSLLLPIPLSTLRDGKSGEICLQSTPSTCGPASAATVLRALGRPVSEREMAADSFTSRRGTEIWYLARAIRRRGLTAEFTFANPLPASLPYPAIAGVRLKGGTGHFIAILRSNPDRVTIADPLWGEVTFGRQKLEKHYRFTGFFMPIHP